MRTIDVKIKGTINEVHEALDSLNIDFDASYEAADNDEGQIIIKFSEIYDESDEPKALNLASVVRLLSKTTLLISADEAARLESILQLELENLTKSVRLSTAWLDQF